MGGNSSRAKREPKIIVAPVITDDPEKSHADRPIGSTHGGAMKLNPGRVQKIGRPARPATRWRCLLISDLHLAFSEGEGYFPKAGEDLMWSALPKIVAHERPLQIFVLGDLFHFKTGPVASGPEWTSWVDACVKRLLESVDGVSEVWFLGGNHDRHVMNERGTAWISSFGERLHVVRGKDCGLELELDSSSGTSKAYLAHDGGNNLRDFDVLPFILGIKEANGIPPESLLVTGHTHHASDHSKDANRVACLGCFAGRRVGGLEYGVLEETEAGDGFVFRPGSGCPK